MAYAGLDAEKFISWYKFIYKKIQKLKFDENCLIVNFEDFVLNNKDVKNKIYEFLNIEEQNTNFNIENSLKNVTKIENDIDKKSLELIKSKLKEFL